ncbi:MAG: hypothetical protein ACOC9P_00040 [bacterium]
MVHNSVTEHYPAAGYWAILRGPVPDGGDAVFIIGGDEASTRKGAELFPRFLKVE